MHVLQLRYHVFEIRLFTGDGGEAELGFLSGEPESGPLGLEWRKAQRWSVDVSSVGGVPSLLHVHYVAFFVGVTNV
jgi:hypothetical protein